MPITTTPSGGPQGEFSTYTPIYAQTLSSNASSITFSNIPPTYTDLVLVCSARSAWTTDEYEAVGFRFNGDSANNYSTTFVAGNGGAAASFRESNQPQITARMNPSTSSNTAFSSIIVQIQDYSNPTTNKTVLIRSNSSVEFYEVAANVGTWRSTAPITSLFVGNARANLVAGSTFTLYGIKAAIPAPKATGGDLVYSDSLYWYHVFNTSGTFVPYTSLTCDYLVVAGGGAGGGQANQGTGRGGGGGGGFRTSIGGSALSLTAIPYTVTVGAGGAGDTDTGTNGSDSVFSTITSTGGGAGSGGTGGVFNGVAGGSGGGATFSGSAGAGNTPSTSPSQGNNGGAASQSLNHYGGGGGGGAGAIGNTGGASNGGQGGAGSAFLSAFYAGGGGGGTSAGGTPGPGGAGGGGAGTTNATNGTAGTANTGGGGGGSGGAAGIGASNGGNGGSGVVIVRYLG